MNYSMNGIAASPKQKNAANTVIAIFSLLLSAIAIVFLIQTALFLSGAGIGTAIVFRNLIMGVPYLQIIFALVILLSKKPLVFPSLYCGFSSTIYLISLIGNAFVGRIITGSYYTWWTSFAIIMYSRFSLLLALFALLVCVIFRNSVANNKKKILFIAVVGGVAIALASFILRTPLSNLFYMNAEADLVYVSVSSFLPFCLCIPFIALNMATGYIILKKRPAIYIVASALQFIATMCVIVVIGMGMAKGVYPVQSLVYSFLIGEIIKAIPLVVATLSVKGDNLIIEVNDSTVMEQEYSFDYTTYPAEPAAKFCSKCGTPFVDGAMFCAKCGNSRNE